MQETPRFSHVIFDLDGTLLDSLADLAATGNHVCELFGWPTYSTDRYRFKVGDGQAKLVERIIPAEFFGDARTFEAALAEFRAYYSEHSRDRTVPYRGIAEMLESLVSAGVRIAVLTNKEDAAAQELVPLYFDQALFSCIQGRMDPFPPKPERPITLHVLERLGADPACSLYVGDSDVDVMCGHNAGMRVAGVTWGFRGEEELEAAGADFLAHTPEELLSIVLG